MLHFPKDEKSVIGGLEIAESKEKERKTHGDKYTQFLLEYS